MSASLTPQESASEHQIFWMLVTKAARRDDVARVYLAVQAALAYKHETVDVGWLMGAMMAEGKTTNDNRCDPIEASGLAYFYWLYEVELSSVGEEDCHYYHFLRRSDGARTMAYLKTAHAPRSLQFQQEYERTRRKLEKKRAALLANYGGHGTQEGFARGGAKLQNPSS